MPCRSPTGTLLPSGLLQAELYGINILTSRGCPFPCAYCQNEFLMDLYRGGGPFVRYRAVENVFAEIDEIIRTYRPSRLSFSDESFTLNATRLEEFCSEYARRFSLPFLCQTRPDLIDGPTARRAPGRPAAISSTWPSRPGTRGIRNDVLERNIDDETDRRGLYPGPPRRHPDGQLQHDRPARRDPSTVWDTIDLNRALQPDRIMCTIYMPFKGTALGEKCLDAGWLEQPIDDSEVYYTYVAIRHPTLSARTLFGYQGFFDYYVRLPRAIHWLVHLLRLIYELLPTATHRLPPPVRLIREAAIGFVYGMKRCLPSRGFFMKTR